LGFVFENPTILGSVVWTLTGVLIIFPMLPDDAEPLSCCQRIFSRVLEPSFQCPQKLACTWPFLGGGGGVGSDLVSPSYRLPWKCPAASPGPSSFR
jgi:hypothetical protein